MIFLTAAFSGSFTPDLLKLSLRKLKLNQVENLAIFGACLLVRGKHFCVQISSGVRIWAELINNRLFLLAC